MGNADDQLQGETLERFVLDKSDCVDGGDGCKAEMRHSIAGAFVYHSEIERTRAAVAGPRGDVSLWREAATIVEACLNVHSTYSDAEREFASHLIEVFKTRDQHPDYRHRNSVRAYPAATSSPAPAEPMQTFDYMCNAQPSCGWRSTDTSRPLSRGIKVGCPNCQGDARFIGATSAPAESESPILAFDKWFMRYVADHGKLTQQEYSIAYAAFIAAHPGEGPLARTMNAAPAESARVAGEQRLLTPEELADIERFQQQRRKSPVPTDAWLYVAEIDRLLTHIRLDREQLENEIFQDATDAAFISDSARRAAEECESLITCLLAEDEKEDTRRKFEAIINRAFAAAPAGNDAEGDR